MKKKEIVFIGIILLIAAVSGIVLKLQKPEQYKSVTISVDGENFGTYSLEEEQIIKINDTNVAEIKDGQISMVEAHCPDQLCVMMGPFGDHGGLIVCLPNKVIIEGENIASDGEELDSIAK